jgi:ribose transport system permease protein
MKVEASSAGDDARDLSAATIDEGTRRASASNGSMSGRLGQLFQRFGLLVVWVATFVFFAVFPQTSQTFPTTANLATIFGSQAAIVFLTLALVVPLTAGDYDLSIAATMTLSAMVIAILNVNDHWPIGAASAVAVAVGAGVGLVNGSLIRIFGIDPFIVTLGTGTFVGGVVLWISSSRTIGTISYSLINIVGVDRFLGIPLEFYYGLGLCIIMWYVFTYTPLGWRLLIVGRGRTVARLSGISVGRVRLGAMVVSGTIAGLAGVIYVGTLGAADPTSGTQLLLPAFAAAFLGATTINPGRFNPWGSLVAVYFLITGITGLQLMGVPSYVQQLFYGGSLVIAVALSQLARRRQELNTGQP